MARRYDAEFDDDEDYRVAKPRHRRIRRSSAAAESKTIGPGIALLVVSLLHLLGTFAYAPIYLLSLSNNPDLIANQHRPGYVLGYYVGAGAVLGVPAIVNLLVAIGGICMVRRQLYPMALIGTFAACIPCCGPLAIMGIPFGIWAAVVLFDPNVRTAFEAAH